MSKKIEIEYCYQCPNHKFIADPDTHDWFRDGDQALVCKLVKTVGRTLAAAKRRKSRYTSDYSEDKVVRGGLSPFEEKKVRISDWCPLED